MATQDEYKSSSDMNHVGGNEILTVCIGQAGVYIGNEYYQRIMEESKINKSGEFTGDINNIKHTSLISKSNVQFITTENNKYIPRAIFADIDCAPIDDMRQSFYGNLMTADNFISSPKQQSSLIWAQGHYTEGAEVIDEFLDKTRNSIELCDNLQGFQFIHGISGGVGGGFGTLYLIKLRDNYPDRVMSSFVVFPSKTFYDERNTNLITYNTILSLHQIIENLDMCFILDNGKVMNGLYDKIGLLKPTINDINWLISMAMSNVTAPYRLNTEPGINISMRQMWHSLTMFPRLHFFGLSVSPFMSPKVSDNKVKDKVDVNVSKIVNELLFVNDISDIKSNLDGKLMTLSIHYRSNDGMAINKMNEFIMKQQNELRDDFISWMPYNVFSGYIDDGGYDDGYGKYSSIMGSVIHHTTAIKSIFQRQCSNFKRVYRRKGYLHWYKGEGMDEMEFQEADKNVRDIIVEYQDKQDAVVALDGENEEDDEEEDEED